MKEMRHPTVTRLRDNIETYLNMDPNTSLTRKQRLDDCRTIAALRKSTRRGLIELDAIREEVSKFDDPEAALGDLYGIFEWELAHIYSYSRVALGVFSTNGVYNYGARRF